MKEKKQFFIPKNYDKKFEWIPGVSGWQHVAFVPVIAIDYFILVHSPFTFSNKVVFALVALGIPWALIGTHPLRDNVPLYKHIVWRLKFLSRQRIFKYRKEGYVNAVQQKETIRESKSEGKETAGNRKEVHSRLDSIKGDRARAVNHSRQQDGSMPKSISR